MKFNISYEANSVPQTILVEANSRLSAERYFLSKFPGVEICETRVAAGGDEEPGVETLVVPADFKEGEQRGLKKTCVSMRCPFIWFCRDYHLEMDRPDGCVTQDRIVEAALRLTRERQNKVRKGRG